MSIQYTVYWYFCSYHWLGPADSWCLLIVHTQWQCSDRVVSTWLRAFLFDNTWRKDAPRQVWICLVGSPSNLLRPLHTTPPPSKPHVWLLEMKLANEESKRELSSALSALFSNRCAARLQLDQGLEALSDARHCVELTPTWPKGHFREGCCLRQLNQLEDAQLAFATGQKLEPENKDWGKEMERTEKLLLAQPAYQAQTRRYPQVWL